MTWTPEKLMTVMRTVCTVIMCDSPEQTMTTMQYFVDNGCTVPDQLLYHLDPSHPKFATTTFLGVKLYGSRLECCEPGAWAERFIPYEEVAHIFNNDVADVGGVDSAELLSLLDEVI